MANDLTNTPNNSLQYLHVRNWGRWQSYRHDRGHPPWIKVHRRLMRNPNWVALTDAQKGQLVSIWMLAADQNGVIPNCPTLIKRLCCLEHEPDLSTLINLGFLDAKMTPRRKTERRQVVAPEAETETETETETDKKVLDHPSDDPKNVLRETKKKEKGTADGSKGTRLPEGWLPSSEVHLFAVGLLGESGTAYQLDKFRDYWLGKAGAAARKTDWDRTFRNWCRSAKERNGSGYNRPQTLKERTADALQRLGSGSLGEIVDIGLPKLGLD